MLTKNSSKNNLDVTEIYTMESILSKIDSQTLVIFDLDDTIWRPNQILGSDWWFENFIKQKLEEGLEISEVLDIAIPIYMAVQAKSDIQAVEPTTAKLIKDLQDRGISVIACTSRDHRMVDTTKRQLDFVGIDFNKDFAKGTDFNISVGEFSGTNGGVVFCGGQHKGKCLDEYFDKLGFLPRKMVFIDDKRRNVDRVGEFTTKNNIEYHGFRYGFLDKELEKNSKEVAGLQLQSFLNVLSDKDAEAIIAYQAYMKQKENTTFTNSVFYQTICNLFADNPSLTDALKGMDERLSAELSAWKRDQDSFQGERLEKLKPVFESRLTKLLESKEISSAMRDKIIAHLFQELEPTLRKNTPNYNKILRKFGSTLHEFGINAAELADGHSCLSVKYIQATKTLNIMGFRQKELDSLNLIPQLTREIGSISEINSRKVYCYSFSVSNSGVNAVVKRLKEESLISSEQLQSIESDMVKMPITRSYNLRKRKRINYAHSQATEVLHSKHTIRK